MSVTVPFRGTARAELPAGDDGAAGAQVRPLWPAIVALSVGVGGAVLTGAAIGASLYDQSAAAGARDIAVKDDGLPLAKADPSGQAWGDGYGDDYGGSTTPTARARWTAIASNFAASNETAATALFVTAGAGLVIAAAGGVSTWLLWPAADGE